MSVNVLIGLICGAGPLVFVSLIILIHNRIQKKRKELQELIQRHGGLIPPDELKRLKSFKKPKKFKAE